ncbi:hypothetical protein B7494_g7296 [Chlorociboria aeruginascens]|nr:hypothetical protein B7494_g7296 [Chlorociboria aeruginascens]
MRREWLTAWALGRTHYEDEIIFNNPSHTPYPNRQLYDAHGHPRNPEITRRERQQVRAANEVLTVTGVVERSSTTEAREMVFRQEMMEENAIGLKYLERAPKILVGGVWGVFGLRRRILLYQSYSETPFLGLLKKEVSTRSIPNLLFAGLPTTFTFTWIHEGWWLLRSYFRSKFVHNESTYSKKRVFLVHATDILLLAGGKYTNLHLRMFSILQQLHLIPASQYFPSWRFLVPFLPGSPISPVPIPSLNFESILACGPVLLQSVAPLFLIHLHHIAYNVLESILYDLIFVTLPQPNPTVQSLPKLLGLLAHDSSDLSYTQREDEPSYRGPAQLATSEPPGTPDLSPDLHESSEDEDEGEINRASMVSFEVIPGVQLPDISSGGAWSAELRNANEPVVSNVPKYRITAMTMLPTVLATEIIKAFVSAVLLVPLEAVMIRYSDFQDFLTYLLILPRITSMEKLTWSPGIMATPLGDPTKAAGGNAISSESDAAAHPQMKNKTEDSEKRDIVKGEDIGKADFSRKQSVHSARDRQISELEAIRIAAAGDFDIINTEVDELEIGLAARNKASRWFKYELKLSDPRYFTWLLVAFASMGGLLSGIDQSLISGANLYMPSSLGLNTKQVSLVSSGVPLGAVGGALLLGPINEAVGRRMAIIISLILYTIGAALEAGSISFGMMVASRVILGLGLGLEGGTVPVYVAESVSRKYRGNLVSLYQFMIALGEVFGYVVAAIFVNVKSGSWRYMLGSSLLFSTIMFAGILFMPESPRFLMHKGKKIEAWGVWKRIRGTDDDARKEFFVMKHTVESEHADIKSRAGSFIWLDFLTVPRARRSIIYANIMVFLGQFTGINAIQYYMATLMQQVGFDDKQSVFMSLVGGGSLLLGTIPAILFMEKFGRRFWAIAMLPGFFIGLVIIGASYTIPLDNKAGSQGAYIAGLIIYEGFFGSYACLTWVIPSEVYPTYLRSYGMETSDAMLFLCSFLVTYFFSQMQQAMTRIGLTLGFYCGIAVLGWFYQILFMPETKNKTLEEIDIIFNMSTRDLVKENLRSSLVTTNDFIRGRWGKVFSSVSESDIYRMDNGPKNKVSLDKHSNRRKLEIGGVPMVETFLAQRLHIKFPPRLRPPLTTSSTPHSLAECHSFLNQYYSVSQSCGICFITAILLVLSTIPLSPGFDYVTFPSNVTAAINADVQLYNYLSAAFSSLDLQYYTYRVYLTIVPPGFSQSPSCYLAGNVNIDATDVIAQMPASVGSDGPSYFIATMEFNQAEDSDETSDIEYSNIFNPVGGTDQWTPYELTGHSIGYPDTLPCTTYDCARNCTQTWYPTYVDFTDLANYACLPATADCIAVCPGGCQFRRS